MTKQEAICALQNDVFNESEFDKVCEALNMAIEALEMTAWIPVSERLPEEGVSVLVYAERNAYNDKGKFRKKVVDIGWQVDGLWHIDGCSGVMGIAWMPLPTAYEESDTE